MEELPGNFDSESHGDMKDGIEPVPKGKYLVHITKSEIKPTKKKTGKYIQFEFTIIDGKYKGRKIWTRMNVINPNPIAVEIAQKEYATLRRACGFAQPVSKPGKLHGIPIAVTVKYVPEDEDWPAKNEITYYESAGIKKGKSSGQNADPKTTSSGQKKRLPWGGKKTAMSEAEAEKAAEELNELVERAGMATEAENAVAMEEEVRQAEEDEAKSERAREEGEDYG